MTRRLVVSDGVRTQQATDVKVAVSGVVKNVTRMCVADNGIVRQFYPTVASETDARIVWTTAPITVIQSVEDPADSEATLTFNRSSGTFSYDNYPLGGVVGIYINPALDGTAGDDGKFLIKIQQDSGDTLTGAAGTWLNLNANHVVSLDQTIVGVLNAVATISIAQDNGSGSPVVSTQIDKVVTFISEVRVTNDVVWSVLQRDLVENKESVDADCQLAFSPEGFATGDADTSGAFTEAWHKDSPVVPDPQNFTVNTTLVSGTAPTGSALGSDLTLDGVRQWTLLATIGETLVCELDVIVDDGVTPITKRVTMASSRTDVTTLNVWEVVPLWILRESNTFPSDAEVSVSHRSQGNATGDELALGEQFNEPWHSESTAASDPENYQVMLEVNTGNGPTSGAAVGVWLPADSNYTWRLTSTGPPLAGGWLYSYRRVGQATVTKQINVSASQGLTP